MEKILFFLSLLVGLICACCIFLGKMCRRFQFDINKLIHLALSGLYIGLSCCSLYEKPSEERQMSRTGSSLVTICDTDSEDVETFF